MLHLVEQQKHSTLTIGDHCAVKKGQVLKCSIKTLRKIAALQSSSRAQQISSIAYSFLKPAGAAPLQAKHPLSKEIAPPAQWRKL
jgi:hypothetical protein